MAWRFADMVLDRRGETSKLRHTHSRQMGKRSVLKSQTLKKLQHGSKRQQQGATMKNISRLGMELFSQGMAILSGVTSGQYHLWIMDIGAHSPTFSHLFRRFARRHGEGNLMCEDLSDIYGKKWYNTTEGQEFIARSQRLEARPAGWTALWACEKWKGGQMKAIVRPGAAAEMRGSEGGQGAEEGLGLQMKGGQEFWYFDLPVGSYTCPWFMGGSGCEGQAYASINETTFMDAWSLRPPRPPHPLPCQLPPP
jgi:hypothetical protein